MQPKAVQSKAFIQFSILETAGLTAVVGLTLACGNLLQGRLVEVAFVLFVCGFWAWFVVLISKCFRKFVLTRSEEFFWAILSRLLVYCLAVLLAGFASNAFGYPRS
jgi:uncharacterized membrane protein YoaK (UPF0700 family)